MARNIAHELKDKEERQLKVKKERRELKLQRYLTAREGMHRLFLGANAGGTIAIVSFVGAQIGAAQDGTFDRTVFFVLMLFAGGLGAAVLFSATSIVYFRLKYTPKEVRVINQLRWAGTFTFQIGNLALAVEGLFAVLGFLMALKFLWTKTV